MNAITVLLAEDHLMVREMLRVFLKREKDMEVVGEAGNGLEAVELNAKLSPSVVVMDIAMPLLSGLEATRRILHESPEAHVLILSAHSDDTYMKQAMSFGASGYLIKQTSAIYLPMAIRAVHNGERFFSLAIAKRIHHLQEEARHHEKMCPAKVPTKLSSREMEVLQLIAEGKANKETAEALQISARTVEKHRHTLMRKLGIRDTAGLTRYAIANYIIEGRER